MATALAGAELGGEIGLLGGPVGAAAGAVIGGLIGLGIGILAVKAVENATSDADANLSDSSTTQACADCGDGPDCFEPPDGANPGETGRQLQEQEDAINKLSPEEMLDRLAKGDARKAADGTFRAEGDAAARAAARDAASAKASDAAYKQAINSGKSLGEAEAAGDAAGKAAVAGKDATHTLDWVAGGDGEISGVGDSKVNRSLGSQWGKRRGNSNSQLTRREQLRKAAEKAKARGKEKMDVDLKEC
jgi:hypothetical protein